MPAVWSVTYSIVEQIRENLLKPHGIALHNQRCLRNGYAQFMLLLINLGGICIDDVTQNTNKIGWRYPQFHLSTGNARYLEQIIDQANHVVDLTADDGQQTRNGGGAVRLGDQRQCIHDRRKRVAQLMRERSDKFVLTPISLQQGRFRVYRLSNVERYADMPRILPRGGEPWHRIRLEPPPSTLKIPDP